MSDQPARVLSPKTKPPVRRSGPGDQRRPLGTTKAAQARRKRLFLAAYIENGGNASQAALSAGYSPKGAGQMGFRLVAKLKDEIEAYGAAEAEKAGLSVARTLQEIARLAYADPRRLFTADGNLVPIHELPAEVAATIASLEIEEATDVDSDGNLILKSRTKKLKVWDKNSALEKAMKFHGLYEKDNVQKSSTTFNLNLAGVRVNAD